MCGSKWEIRLLLFLRAKQCKRQRCKSLFFQVQPTTATAGGWWPGARWTDAPRSSPNDGSLAQGIHGKWWVNFIKSSRIFSLTCSRQSKLNKFSKLKGFSLKIKTFHLNSREIPNFPHENKRIFAQSKDFFPKLLGFGNSFVLEAAPSVKKSFVDDCFQNFLQHFVLPLQHLPTTLLWVVTPEPVTPGRSGTAEDPSRETRRRGCPRRQCGTVSRLQNIQSRFNPQHTVTYLPYSINLGKKLMSKVIQKSEVLNMRCKMCMNIANIT